MTVATMIATSPTFLKRSTDPATELPPTQKKAVAVGEKYGVESFERAANGHVKVTLAAGAGTWFIFDPEKGGHWTCDLWDDWEEDDQPITPAKTSDKGVRMVLPGNRIVYAKEPIIAGGSFSWGEALHAHESPPRIPNAGAHVRNIEALATQLERFLQQIGKPFRVTSWYRPNPWNQRAGGAKRSTHLDGRGVDIVVEGFTGAELARRAEWWPGGRGIYPGNRAHILHLDIGPKRKWGF